MNLIQTQYQTITTLSLLSFINEARALHKEPATAYRHFLARVEDEIDDLPPRKIFTHPSNGQESTLYDLSLEQATLVGMRESKAVRRAVLEKLKELQAKQATTLPDFTDHVAAARAWADAKEAERNALALAAEKEKQLELAAPKVEFVDRFVERTALQNATQVAQTLGISAVAMNRRLDEIGGVYNKACKRGRVFTQAWVDKGYGETKQTQEGYPQPLFTTSGAAAVAQMFVSEGLV